MSSPAGSPERDAAAGTALGEPVRYVGLVTPTGGRVKPPRALVRWIGMNAALIPLPWGFVPIPFGRKGFPDWLAHTRVIEASQLSIAEARRQRLRQARDGSSPAPPASGTELSADPKADLRPASGSEPTD